MNGLRVPSIVFAAGIAVVMLSSSAAHAQVFSPGALSRPHASLEGVGNCTKCHGEGNQQDNGRCLACHAEIGKRQSAGRGFHGRNKGTCAECHEEHKGLDANIGGMPASKLAFRDKHGFWALQGAHRKADCNKCHEPRRIVEDDARKLQATTRKGTWLGLPTTCVECHFDEHRGQEGNDCNRCHGVESFKKAPQFNHNKMAGFPLAGKHKDVGCSKCHGILVDTKTSAGAFPAPAASTYLQMKDIAHGSCTDCHEDAHAGAFGRNCTQCHTPDGWSVIKQGAENTGFHDKTQFPLRGEHNAVACKKCHGPFGRDKAVFKGLPHAHCTDCHADSHLGQIPVDDKSKVVPCERCHTTSGFVPVLFTMQMHNETPYRLEGGHAAVACTACHTDDDKIPRKVPSTVKARFERMNRRMLLSPARIKMPELQRLDDKVIRCDACHTDVHAGQFDASTIPAVQQKGCNACHQADSFRDELFQHADSRFPLTGKHATVACTMCHVERDVVVGRKKQSVVTYRPLPQACQACHADEHVGQLKRNGVTDCTRCHDTSGFKPSKFNHDDPAQSRFALQGKHRGLACDKCHVVVDVRGDKTARYKPLPITCEGCHDDEHKGSFGGYLP